MLTRRLIPFCSGSRPLHQSQHFQYPDGYSRHAAASVIRWTGTLLLYRPGLTDADTAVVVGSWRLKTTISHAQTDVQPKTFDSASLARQPPLNTRSQGPGAARVRSRPVNPRSSLLKGTCRSPGVFKRNGAGDQWSQVQLVSRVRTQDGLGARFSARMSKGLARALQGELC